MPDTHIQEISTKSPVNPELRFKPVMSSMAKEWAPCCFAVFKANTHERGSSYTSERVTP